MPTILSGAGPRSGSARLFSVERQSRSEGSTLGPHGVSLSPGGHSPGNTYGCGLEGSVQPCHGCRSVLRELEICNRLEFHHTTSCPFLSPPLSSPPHLSSDPSTSLS